MEYILYFSRAVAPDRNAALTSILASAERNNAALGLTGLLLYGEGMFVQLLEGPSEPLETMFQRILADPRHAHTVVLSRGEQGDRMFPDWAMGARVLCRDYPGQDHLLGASAGELEARFDGALGRDMLAHMKRFYTQSVSTD